MSVMTSNNLNSFLTALDSDLQKAEEAYQRLRTRLKHYLEGEGCASADSDDLVDEVIGRVLSKIKDGITIGSIPGYCVGVARNVLLEYFRRKKMHVDIDGLPPSEQPYTDPIAKENEHEQRVLQERQHECIEKCLGQLLAAPETTQVTRLFIRYYAGENIEDPSLFVRHFDSVTSAEREQLAKEFTFSRNDLITKVNNFKDRKLRPCCEKCIENQYKMK